MRWNALLAVLALAVASQAQNWTLDASHSSITFSVKHLAVSTVKGEFDKFSGSLTGDPKKPETLKPAISIEAASVNTKNEKRDGHLRGEDFFETAKFPNITFAPEKTVVRNGQPVLLGTLTMKGVSKKVEIPYTIAGPVVDPWKNTKLGLEGSFVINRKDYGVSWSALLDNGGAVVSDEVKVDVAMEYALAPEEKK